MAGFLAELTKDADKSQWVQVNFCVSIMDGEIERRVKTYLKKGIAKREISKWLKRSPHNFCRYYEYDTDKWFIQATL
jgi:uncharacterized membrane-anchored protein